MYNRTTVSEDGESKTCTKCGGMQPKESFHILNRGILGRNAWCKSCMSKARAKCANKDREHTRKKQKEYYLANKEMIQRNSRKWRIAAYGLTTLDYDELCENGCQICGIFVDRLYIDHDHSCCTEDSKSCGDCVRGVLCPTCNYGLGNFKDDIKLLLAAFKYLQNNRMTERKKEE